MTPDCHHQADIEALFDGRLAPATARELSSHVEGCATCAGELSALRSLRAELRDATPAPNAFAMKRLRRTVLDRAAGRVAQTGAIPVRRLWPLVAAVVLAALGFGAGIFFTREPAREVSLVAGQGASYSTDETGDRHVVRIAEGVFDFDVHARADGKRLLVVVPDGEIEDIGTRFRVVVSNGTTTEVSVTSGEVELRRHGFAPVRLVAGMSYHPVPVVAAATAADPGPPVAAVTALPSAVAAAPSSSAPVPTSVVVAARGTVASRTPVRNEHEATPHAATAAPDQVVSKATTAPTLAEPPPAGITPEDGAYLRVIHLLRQGNDREARAAAQDYLARFPEGLRAVEMRRVASGGP